MRQGAMTIALALCWIAFAAMNASAIDYGDVWFAINNGQVVLISGSDGHQIAKTTGLPAPKSICVSPTDGTLYVACSDGKIYHVALDGSHTLFCDL